MTNKKIPLTSQVRDLFIVIRKNKVIPKKTITEYCESMFDKYAFIEHKNDIEPITGLVEGCHYHIWAHVRDKGVAKSTHINAILKAFKFDTDDGICIEQIANKVLAMQYLIHKNNPEKTQHEVKDVVSNIDKDELNLMFTSDTGEVVSFDLIYTLCRVSTSICQIIKALGINVYRQYRNVVLDIYNDVKTIDLETEKEKELSKEIKS